MIHHLPSVRRGAECSWAHRVRWQGGALACCSVLTGLLVLVVAGTAMAQNEPLDPRQDSRVLPVSQSLLVPGVALIQCADGASWEEDGTTGEAEVGLKDLGELRQGLAQIAAVGGVTILAGEHRVSSPAGLFQLEVDPSGIRVCVREGRVEVVEWPTVEAGEWPTVEAGEWPTVEAGEWPTVEAGSCLAAAPSGMWELRPLIDENGDWTGQWVTLVPSTPPGTPILFEDDPSLALGRLDQSVRLQRAAGGGESSDVEASGAAACLEGGGESGSAEGGDGAELPETEIDRTQHRLDLDISLEGF